MSRNSKRSNHLSESITLKLNAKASALASEGKEIFNLTAGQLPFKPHQQLTDLIQAQGQFLKSYHYSPVPGFPELRQKFKNHISETRKINLDNHECIISNGGKHSLSVLFSTIIDPGDEVILFAPYWVSYPHMISLCDGVMKTVDSELYNNFTPTIDDIEKQITDKTKAIILNSPSNPAGIHLEDNWMRDFAKLLEKYPNILVISDEIYFHLNYFDPSPTYYYQHNHKLLERTIIVDGISKSFASTGLRLGVTIAPKDIFDGMKKVQGHTASGANSLVQKALIEFDFYNLDEFLEPVKKHLRENVLLLEKIIKESDLGPCWYQPLSAFYFFLDFRKTPVFSKFNNNDEDLAPLICEQLLEEYGVALVPGGDFGSPNCARLSLVNEKAAFEEAIQRLCKFLNR